jgi:hypothetical protein
VLQELPVKVIAEGAGVSERTFKAVRAAGTRPRRPTREALIGFAADRARERLRAAESEAPRDDLAALAAYLDLHGGTKQVVRCRGCGEALHGRRDGAVMRAVSNRGAAINANLLHDLLL